MFARSLLMIAACSFLMSTGCGDQRAKDAELEAANARAKAAEAEAARLRAEAELAILRGEVEKKKPGTSEPAKKSGPVLNAQELFEAVGKNLARAKTLRIVVNTEVDANYKGNRLAGDHFLPGWLAPGNFEDPPTSKGKGILKERRLASTVNTFLLARGNKSLVILNNPLALPGEKEEKMISNGENMFCLPNLQKTVVPKNLNRIILNRIHEGTTNIGDLFPWLREPFMVSDFQLGDKKKIGGQQTQEVKYKLGLEFHPGTISVILRLNQESGLPLERWLYFGEGQTFISYAESYDIEINPEIHPKDFELSENQKAK